MEERLVVVMGATGSGKSSLIKLATGDQRTVIGHSLKSETKSISLSSFEIDSIRITIADTPGFDDTYLSDRDVLESVSSWLTGSYRKGTRISAIFYLHRISDTRMQGSALRNLRVFRNLCGQDCFDRITLCTTFWDLFEIDAVIPNSRLDELHQPEFWGDMISMGSKITKAPTSEQEAKQYFFSATRPEPTIMQVQREIVDEGKNLDETAAMLSFMELELQRQREEHEREMHEIRAQWQRDSAASEAQRNRELETMRTRFEEELERQRATTQQMEHAMQRRMSEQDAQRSQLLREMERLELRSVRTEHNIPNQATIVVASVPIDTTSRQRVLDTFNSNVNRIISELQMGIRQKKVRCGWNPIKLCYTLVCSYCLMSIGRKQYYECLPCSNGSQQFVLCTRCYSHQTIACNATDHDKASMVRRAPPNPEVDACPRVIAPPQDRMLRCSKCKQNCGSVYFHCCQCNHAFDMCVDCALRGRHCPGHGRSFPWTPHLPELCSRHIGPG